MIETNIVFEVLPKKCPVVELICIQKRLTIKCILQETLTDLIWYCNCKSILYFEVLRPSIINILQKCSDPDE